MRLGFAIDFYGNEMLFDLTKKHLDVLQKEGDDIDYICIAIDDLLEQLYESSIYQTLITTETNS